MPEVVLNEHDIGVQVFKKAYPKIDSSSSLLKSVDYARRHGESVERSDKDKKISLLLARLENVLEEKDSKKREFYQKRLFRSMHDRSVIKPGNIPDSYYKSVERNFREQGHGNLKITEEIKRQHENTIISDQINSLDEWIEYLTSTDAMYPTWFKYFCLRGVQDLKPYDKESKKFYKRDKYTVAMFPELNSEALGMVLEKIREHRSVASDQTDGKWANLVRKSSFADLYGHAIESLESSKSEYEDITEGEWRVFKEKTSPDALVESLKGKNTGWCTASSRETAKQQLDGGDFYVYYTKGNPRIGIRMQGKQVAEVHGVGERQNMENSMVEIAKKKLETLPGGSAYEKKVSDMRELTLIEDKIKNNLKLTTEEISFLWETNNTIEGFGLSGKDPRVEELRATRDYMKDFPIILSGKSLDAIIKRSIRDFRLYKSGRLTTFDIGNRETMPIDKMVEILELKKDAECTNKFLHFLINKTNISGSTVLPMTIERKQFEKLVHQAGKFGDSQSAILLRGLLDKFEIKWNEKGLKSWQKDVTDPAISRDVLEQEIQRIESKMDAAYIRQRNKINSTFNVAQKMVLNERSLIGSSEQGVILKKFLREHPDEVELVGQVLEVAAKKYRQYGTKSDLNQILEFSKNQQKKEFYLRNSKLISEYSFMADYMLDSRLDPLEIKKEGDWNRPDYKFVVDDLVGFGSVDKEKIFEYFARDSVETNKKTYHHLKSMLQEGDKQVVSKIFGDAELWIEKSSEKSFGEYIKISLKSSEGGSHVKPWGIGISERGEIIYAMNAGKKVSHLLSGVLHGTWNGVAIKSLIADALFYDFSTSETEKVFHNYLFGDHNPHIVSL